MANSVLKDFLDGIDIIKKDAKDFIKDLPKNQSLSKQSKKGTLQFPVIVTRSLSLEDASMITKALERQCVSFIRVVTSMSSVTKEEDVEEYLKKLHQNIELGESFTGSIPNADLALSEYLNRVHDLNLSLDNLISEDAMIIEHSDLPLKQRKNLFNKINNLMEGNCFLTKKGIFNLNEDGMVSELFLIENADDTMDLCQTMPIPQKFNVSKANVTVMKNQIKSKLLMENKEYVSPFNETCLNDLSHATEAGILNEAKGKVGIGKINSNSKKIASPGRQTNKVKINAKGSTDTVINVNGDNDKKIDPETIRRVDKDGGLLDNDVKKANELVPTMLRLITNFQDKDGKIVRTEEYLIGVKAEMHPVSTQSMVENLVKGIKKNNTFFNFIKFTTGETSFFKDFVLALNDIKDDVKSKYRDNVWWTALKRRRQKAKILGRIKAKQFLPNATIIVSQDEINLIKQTYKLDLEKVEHVKTLMDTYFLLGFVICDPSTESCRFLFDGDKDFTTYSYASLERENSNKTKEISNIMQILGKM